VRQVRSSGLARGRRLGLMSAVAAAGAALALAVSAGPALTATQSARPARLAVGMDVLHFATHGRTLRGVGAVTATLTDPSGQKSTSRSIVAFTAATGGRCRILNLTLNQLHLSLLGLNVDLAKVVLTITGIRSGHPNGGVLGSLFCSLAGAKLASAGRARAARSLSQRLATHHNRMLHFTVFLRPRAATAAAGATCPVLDLILGPLHLNLLGLVVDLNQVHLTVTATQGGGILGNLFCGLSTTTLSTPATPAPAAP